MICRTFIELFGCWFVT